MIEQFPIVHYFVIDLPACRATVALSCDSVYGHRRITCSYPDYRVESAVDVDVHLSVTTCNHGWVLETPWGRNEIQEEKEQIETPRGLEKTRRLDALLDRAFLQALCTCDPSLEPIHAACVQKNNRCLVLTGMPASGKTTLALALCSLGWHMVTDDVLLVRMPGGEAWPIRRCFNLEPAPGLFELEDFIEPGTLSQIINNHFSAFFSPAYLSKEKQLYPLTDIIFMDGFASYTRLSVVPPEDGLTRLARLALLPQLKDRAMVRLLRYATALKYVHWWSCRAGHPLEAAHLLDEGSGPANLSG